MSKSQRANTPRRRVGLGRTDSTPHAGTCPQDSGPTETISEAPGAYGSCSSSYTAGAAPYETASTLAPWLNPEEGVAARHSPGHRPAAKPSPCGQTLRSSGQEHAVVHTDASITSWGATYDRQAVSGVWTGPQLHWHISCLELLAVRLALNRLKGLLRGKHVLVRTDNTATAAYISRQGGLCSRCMSQLARILLLWRSTQLVAGPVQVCVSPSEPPRTDTVQDQGGQGAGPFRGTLLAHRDLVPRANAPCDSPSLADSSEEGSTDSERGHPMAPASRPLETTCLVPGWDMEVLDDLPQGVVDTITSARAQSTRHSYALKWNLLVETPKDARSELLSPSTLKVYVAAITAHHDPIEGKSVGKHDLVIRLNPPWPPSVPSWDLSLVLTALRQAPFQPLQSVELKFLSMKTLLLLALASIKRIGDLHTFSFGPADSQVTLRPWPGYVAKVPTTPFRNQVVSLQVVPPEEADRALALLVPSEP
ncbi:hypothetical protein M9458_023714 [Cirrhinus mrigala]|uniref:Reverse transcriptase RNase H-like domain-containing protein n=1 Tax=Cirrhinus mrigala TaxID=683832 RepID=A0ABD0Q6M4_CIRMR